MVHATDIFPPTVLLGRCGRCKAVVFDQEPHEWADPFTNKLCWPHEGEARLYCGPCSDARVRERQPDSLMLPR